MRMCFYILFVFKDLFIMFVHNSTTRVIIFPHTAVVYYFSILLCYLHDVNVNKQQMIPLSVYVSQC